MSLAARKIAAYLLQGFDGLLAVDALFFRFCSTTPLRLSDAFIFSMTVSDLQAYDGRHTRYSDVNFVT